MGWYFFWWSGGSFGGLEAAEEEGGGGVPIVLAFENLSQLSPEPSHAEHHPRNAQEPLQGPLGNGLPMCLRARHGKGLDPG